MNKNTKRAQTFFNPWEVKARTVKIHKILEALEAAGPETLDAVRTGSLTLRERQMLADFAGCIIPSERTMRAVAVILGAE
jgi:hypothetical protein